MPDRYATLAQESHRQWRSIDNANTLLLKEPEIVFQRIVVQRVVTEIEDALHCALLTMLYDPLQIVQLQVCDADMSYNTLLPAEQPGTQYREH